MAKFEDITSTDQTSSYMAIASLDNIASDVFLFADIEILDANLAAIPSGQPNVDYTPAARARYLCFTTIVSPPLIVPGVMDFDTRPLF